MINNTNLPSVMNTMLETKEKSGSVVQINGLADGLPLNDVVVGINPVQGFNGYDKPWPGGGGKNLFPGSQNDIVPVTAGEKIAISGKSTGAYQMNIKYFKSDSSSFGASSIIAVGETSGSAVKTVPNDAVSCTLYAASSGDFSTFSEVQIERGDTVTAFAPYANICPITGWTGVKVTGAAKNLLDPNNPAYTNILVSSSGGLNSNSNYNTWRVRIQQSMTVSITATEATNPGRVVVFGSNGVVSSTDFANQTGRRAISFTLTSGQYALISIRKSATNYQLELGTETSYTAFSGATYPATWNLINIADSENGGIDTSGANVNASNNWRSKGYIPIEAGKAYTLSASSTFADIVCRIYWYDSSKNFISPRVVENKKVTATAPNNAAYAKWTFAIATDFTQEIAESADLQLEQGSNKTSYKPYCPIVYSGEFDITTGVLTVDKVIVDMGSLTYNYDSTNDFFTVTPSGIKTPLDSISEELCSTYKINAGISDSAMATVATGIYLVLSNGKHKIKDTRYSSGSDLATALTGQKLIYPLATPLTYQLTPTQVTLLLGQNNLFADSGDLLITDGGYLPALVNYIDTKIAEALGA